MTTNLYTQLAKARVQLQKSNLKKSGLNSFSKFKYFELSDFLPRVNEIFDELGLCSNFYIETEITVQGECIEMAHLKIFNSNNVSECIDFKSTTADAEIKGATPIQMLGGKHTYMRRYLWLAAMEIVENDDQDAQDNTTTTYHKSGNSLTSNRKITPNQIATIKKYYKDENLQKLLQVNNLLMLEDMSMSKAHEIIEKLKEKAGNNNVQ